MVKRKSTPGNLKEREVQFEVVVKSLGDSRSIYDPDAFASVANLDEFRSHKGRSIETARKLQKRGITVHHIGDFSISASCSDAKFESFFGTKISQHRLPKKAQAPADYLMRAPKKGEDWKIPKKDNLDQLIERAYVQHEPLLFAGERPIPPFWRDKFRLRVPVDVAQIMKAASVHKKGITGDGVRVVMPDTGFYHHPYFKEQGYNFLAVTTPDVVDYTSDSSGHGTGECANLLATAPGINFIGLKMGSTTLAIKTATELRPDVVTCSWGYSVDGPLAAMPNWLKSLHLAVLDAVSKGITVCFSAGNGHYGFPGSMPEVISVGGVVVDEKLNYSATNYTSGFKSTWFPGRVVPDVSGLCGTPPSADYIILPVQKGVGTDKGGGWGAFSGTSASSPMVAGVCALLKEADPGLTPNDIKNILKYTARDITVGKNAMGFKATPGPDLATGYGLVDAERAMEAIL